MAEGLFFYDHGSIGSWGLRIGEHLVADYQVPVAFINGAVGGTAISLHLRNDADPMNLNTIYGRLLFRAEEAGVRDSARAMFWYQGESDGEFATRYEGEFATLYQSWLEDYPSLEKKYVVQIRKGCGVALSGVREVLRRLPESYADIEVMSTTALPGHDGCHYFYEGYRELGDRVARLVARDFYGSTDVIDIEAPNIVSAQFIDPLVLELTFENDQDTLVWGSGSHAFFFPGANC